MNYFKSEKWVFWVMKRVLLTCLIALSIFSCADRITENEPEIALIKESPYLNHHDSAFYVGKEACRDCHYQNYVSYLRTGMGRSFGYATPAKSDAVIGPDSLIFDKHKNLFYHPFWKDSTLMVTEFRLEGTDTIHKRTERVDFIIGSGNHTNSHISVVNGYAYQIPFTYYTQEQRFDLPPGFENGENTRFSRYLGLECISCHNGLPELVLGSQNKYTHIPVGIDCERCHGPGSIHVRRTKTGILVDTSKMIDYSIVNPRRLSKKLQNDVCARCHLQGTMVLKNGKSFYDFKPGMALTDVMDVFMPSYEGGPPTLIMASHIERMMESACYLKTDGDISCIQCHNPHITVAETSRSVFNKVCADCHGIAADAHHKKETITNKSLDDCVQCHMLKRDSRDIPHVKITDHKISLPETDTQIPTRFKGLVAVNNRHTDPFTKGRGYLREYETFYQNPIYLDSARMFLQPQTKKTSRSHFKAFVQYYFLTDNYGAIRHLVKANGIEEILSNFLIKQDYENEDAWAAYRVGQAFEQNKDRITAWAFYKKAIELAPLHAGMMNKFGSLLVSMDSIPQARKVFARILTEHPRNEQAWVNHGYCEMQLNNISQAQRSYQMAISLNPDNIQALVNLASLFWSVNNKEQAEVYLKRSLLISPEHRQALALKAAMNK